VRFFKLCPPLFCRSTAVFCLCPVVHSRHNLLRSPTFPENLLSTPRLVFLFLNRSCRDQSYRGDPSLSVPLSPRYGVMFAATSYCSSIFFFPILAFFECCLRGAFSLSMRTTVPVYEFFPPPGKTTLFASSSQVRYAYLTISVPDIPHIIFHPLS